MKNHCIVCAASDCDVVKENEQLKEIIKVIFYIDRNNILTTDYFTKKYYKIKDKYKQMIIDILEAK